MEVRVEDSEEEEEKPPPFDPEKLESPEEENQFGGSGRPSPQNDSLSADKESTAKTAHYSSEESAGSHGEIMPAFVTARSLVPENFLRHDVFLSPGFRSAAAMAGWDDEALLLAAGEGDPCLNLEVQEDKQAVPEVRSPALFALSPQLSLVRDTRDKKREERTPQMAATPLSAARRHRRARRQAIHECSPEALPIGDLSLKEEFQAVVSQPPKEEEEAPEEEEDIPEARGEQDQQNAASSTSGHSAGSADATNQKPACLDQLREELSCAICLDICYEPSTTSCGHSFCKGCMESVLAKCGPRCPKCRQQLKGDTCRSCPVNIVLWNTVQLLFPVEVAVKKEAVALAAKSEAASQREELRRLVTQPRTESVSMRGTTWQHARPPSSGLRRRGSGRRMVTTHRSREEEAFATSEPVESEPNVVSLNVVRERQVLADAAFARHLQMQLMSGNGGVHDHRRSSTSSINLASAAANLRAMANRAVRHRSRR